MSSLETREDILLEALLPRYRAEGYTVVVHPSASILPPFMGKYRPDAIALSPTKKIAIEIKQDRPSADLTPLVNTFSEHPDWELRVYSVAAGLESEPVKAPQQNSIERAVADISSLRQSERFAPALMLGWATLEAVGRALLPDTLARPQPAARLVEVLATEGLVTPDDADSLRQLADLRNAVAHGELERTVGVDDIDKLTSVLTPLAEMLSRTKSRANR